MPGPQILCISVRRTRPKKVVLQEFKGGELTIAYYSQLVSYRQEFSEVNCRSAIVGWHSKRPFQI